MFCIVMLCCCATAAVASIDTKSGKYAALVMDADTGEVFYARNADARRYPASLTKMMTLYMLFEQMNRGKMTADTVMKVSKRAASQPQTNISLREGQTIPVRDAIKALVVRSANDVAVVVAEALGGSEWNFALNMTNKAKQLGMRSTQFRNAHGLPDREQYTTARDMAKLSAALRRDFPHYYHYFKTESFVWKGQTYTGHNRVMGRFAGVDGIKTGYINMSGFNLATSVNRDGYHMVAVVMGGQTGKVRDDHMISLLDKTFTTLAKRGDQPRAFASAPVPSFRPDVIDTPQEAEKVIAMAEAESAKKAKVVQVAALQAPKAQIEVKEVAKTSATAQKQEQKQEEARSVNTIRLINPAAPQPAKEIQPAMQTLNAQLAKLSTAQDLSEDWGIQVGAFDDPNKAMTAVAGAAKLARPYLRNSKISIGDLTADEGSIHRARFANLSESQARKACETLVKNQKQCFVYKVKSTGARS
jgi:D-alanyl-D-alanine carboxypeptidase